MSSNFISDRGPAEYFHGRKEIIDTFNSALELFQDKKKGTTFLIQGAPGAGKTALIDVLAREASDQGWNSVHIGTNTLWKPDDLLHRLGKKTNMRVTGASVEAGIDKYVKASAALSVDIFSVAQTIIKGSTTFCVETIDFGSITFIFSYKIHLENPCCFTHQIRISLAITMSK